MVTRQRVGIAGMVTMSLALASAPALGRESPSSLERVLWTGPSAGAPSDAKRVVLTSLFALSAASLVGTGYFAHRWARADDELEAIDRQGVCFELASRSCGAFLDAQVDARAAQRYTAASAAAAMAFLVSGVLVARYWQNTTVGFGVSPSVASLQFRTQF